MMLPEMLDLASVRAFYEAGGTAVDLADALATRMEEAGDPAIFITRCDRRELCRQAEELVARAPSPFSLPLWGVPFAVKDNIDVAGFDTTAGCPSFSYVAAADAFVVSRLRAAGALFIGKTNLDQFATGLNGTRSPYGAPRCVFDSRYISGGSSSGSAVAVASGLASFALGTDTAGSGRVPAALNNIVGIKPTPGRVSTNGLVPACRSLDVISVFAGCVADGVEVRRIMEGFDAADPFSRRLPSTIDGRPARIGVLSPKDRAFYGDGDSERLYDEAVNALSSLDAAAVAFDFEPFHKIAVLLYGGPWVAERLAAIEAFFADHAADVDPTVREIIDAARNYSAVDAFKGQYELAALRRQTEATWGACDALLLPTAPTTYTVEAMQADPIALNANLGHYTNFANLLGLAAIALPAGFRSDGLPFGVTLVGPAGSDDTLASLADRLHRHAASGMGLRRLPVRSFVPPSAAAPRLELAVVGAHLSGMPLNAELTSRGAALVRVTRTTPDYRFYALAGTTPPKPGLIRDPSFHGPGIEVEVWSLQAAKFAEIVAGIPSPLGIGRLSLADGTTVCGFLCEPWSVRDAREITQFGGWRSFTAERSFSSPAATLAPTECSS